VPVGYEAGWAPDDMEKYKFLSLPRLESGPLAVEPVASVYTDCATAVLLNDYVHS
jgi:hypothetical protein